MPIADNKLELSVIEERCNTLRELCDATVFCSTEELEEQIHLQTKMKEPIVFCFVWEVKLTNELPHRANK